MKWLYHYEHPWHESGENPIQTIYLRPTVFDERDEQMVGKIVQVHLIAMEYFFSLEENPLNYDEALKIYHEIQGHQAYKIVERDIEDEDFMAHVEIYLLQTHFDERELFEWVNKYFAMNGLEVTEFERASGDAFLELNPIMRLFSEKNAKKFEAQLGKNWWKRE